MKAKTNLKHCYPFSGPAEVDFRNDLIKAGWSEFRIAEIVLAVNARETLVSIIREFLVHSKTRFNAFERERISKALFLAEGRQ